MYIFLYKWICLARLGTWEVYRASDIWCNWPHSVRHRFTCILCWCFPLGYVNGKIYIQIYLSILRARPLAVWCSHLMYKRRAAEEDYTRLAALSTGTTHFWCEDTTHIEALVTLCIVTYEGSIPGPSAWLCNQHKICAGGYPHPHHWQHRSFG